MKRTKSKVIIEKECKCEVDKKQPSLLSKIVEKLKGTFKKKEVKK
jgi:glutamate 5-kinase